nr:MAG TPA: hypothetical protein [Caudoviricetes sp.]
MSIYNQGFGGGMNPSITVTTTVGATVTVTLGTKSVTAIATGGTAKISVWDYGSYSVHAALGDAVGDATVDVVAVQDYTVTVETVVPIPTVLNNATWAQIKEVAEKSQGANYWAVGDTKQITINGKLSDGLTLSNYQTWVYIIGFDHNKDVEGTGIAFQGFKTAQTGGTDVALCDGGYGSTKSSGQWFNMNNAQSNTGGWQSSRMRSTTLPVVKAAFPSDLQAALKTTTIYTDNTGGLSTAASNVTTTQDTLYLLAEFEIFGARAYANSAEQNHQQQYAYYVSGNSKIKYNHSSTATAVDWWDRSVDVTNSTTFCAVYASGVANRYYADSSSGFSPAFKVGGVVTKPASMLPVGASVYAKESGTPAEFIVVHQGNPDASIYDVSCDGTWLMRKDLYNGQAWNTSGNNRWQLATLQQWLRDTYVNYLDVSSIIKSVKIPCGLGLGTNTVYTGADGLDSKVFLLSGYEVGTGGVNYLPKDGAKLDWFNASTGTSTQRIAYLHGNAIPWWLRTPYADSSSTVWFVGSNSGSCSTNSVNNGYGVRPCFIIPSDAEIDENGNIVI